MKWTLYLDDGTSQCIAARDLVHVTLYLPMLTSSSVNSICRGSCSQYPTLKGPTDITQYPTLKGPTDITHRPALEAMINYNWSFIPSSSFVCSPFRLILRVSNFALAYFKWLFALRNHQIDVSIILLRVPLRLTEHHI